MTQFSGQFSITKKENLRYNFFLMRKKLIATSIMVFVIIGAMVGFVRYAQGTDLSLAIVNGLLMAILGTVILVGINVITTILRINSMYRQKKLTDFAVTFTADQTGIHAVSDRGNSDLAWNRIVAVHETRNAFYIFITESYANVMPKDQIPDARAMEAFRALLVAHVEKSRLKIKSA